MIENTDIKPPNHTANESNDQLLKQLDAIKEDGWLKNSFKKFNGFKLSISLIVILSSIFIFQTDEVKDIWRWIKVQAHEAFASGPTLSTDPIGVFSNSFVMYSENIGELDTDDLLPLVFRSITRFKLDALRFKAEFTVTSRGGQWSGCSLMAEGSLDKADGGVDSQNYITYIKCESENSILLEGYQLLAFPPEVNRKLAPAEYYLHRLEG